MRIKLLLAVLLTAILSACTMSRPASPPAETLGDPAAAGQMDATDPSTTTSEQPVTGPTKSIGTPVPGWENIPIMPGAYAGELEDLVYLYWVNDRIENVEEYYQTKMSVNGWKLIQRQIVETGSPAGPSTVLDFQKNEQWLNIMLVNIPDQNATTVLLSQLGP